MVNESAVLKTLSDSPEGVASAIWPALSAARREGRRGSGIVRLLQLATATLDQLLGDIRAEILGRPRRPLPESPADRCARFARLHFLHQVGVSARGPVEIRHQDAVDVEGKSKSDQIRLLERTYIVLTGELFVSTDTGSETLGPLDSCYLPAGEERLLENRTNRPTTFLVVMPKK